MCTAHTFGLKLVLQAESINFDNYIQDIVWYILQDSSEYFDQNAQHEDPKQKFWSTQQD